MNRENTIGETGTEQVTLPSDRVLRAALFIDEMIDHLPQIKQRARETFVLGAVTVLGILGQIHPEPAVAESASGRRHIPIESLDTHTVAPAMAGSPPPPRKPQQQETGTAVPTVEATPTPTGEVSGKGIPPGQRFTINLPLVIDQAKKVYHTPTLTASVPPPKESPTSTVPIVTNTPEDPTATSTATATEQIPLSERLPIGDGTEIDVRPSAHGYYHFQQGDPVASALGYNSPYLEHPRREGDRVWGKISISADNPETPTTESYYDEVVSVKISDLNLTDEQTQQIPLRNPENPEDEVDEYTHVLHEGTYGPYVRDVGGPKNGESMTNGYFQADLTRQEMTVTLDGSSTSPTGQKAQITIDSIDVAFQRLNALTLEYAPHDDLWSIHNVGYSGGSGIGPVLYRFPENQRLISFKVKGNSLIIPGQDSITLPNPLTTGINHETTLGGAARNPNARLTMNHMDIRISQPLPVPVERTEEGLLPTTGELAGKAGLIILAPTGRLGDQAASRNFISLVENAGTLVNAYTPEDDAIFKDRQIPRAPAIVKSGASIDLEAIEAQIQKEEKGTLFRADSADSWFDQKGELTIPLRDFLAVETKVQKGDGRLLLDINTSLFDANVSAKIADRVQYLTAHGIDPSRLIVTFSGDQELYDGHDDTQITNALSAWRQRGVNTGLMHVRARLGEPEWFEKVTNILFNSGSLVLGPEHTLETFPITKHAYYFDFTIKPEDMGVDPTEGLFKFHWYSPGFYAVRTALVDHVIGLHGGNHPHP